MSLPSPPILVVSSRRISYRPLSEQLFLAAKGGCRWFMLREKDLKPPELTALGREVLQALEPWPVTLSVNGCLETAVELGLKSLHLPQGSDVAAARRRLGPKAFIGLSVHNAQELRAAEKAGVDYVTLSPVFTSISKGAFRPPLGLEGFARLVRATPLRVVALGGIEVEKVTSLKMAGAAGLAFLGGVMMARDCESLCRRTISLWEEVRG